MWSFMCCIMAKPKHLYFLNMCCQLCVLTHTMCVRACPCVHCIYPNTHMNWPVHHIKFSGTYPHRTELFAQSYCIQKYSISLSQCFINETGNFWTEENKHVLNTCSSCLYFVVLLHVKTSLDVFGVISNCIAIQLHLFNCKQKQ